MNRVNRRTFLTTATGVAAAAAWTGRVTHVSAAASTAPRKAVYMGMLPKTGPTDAAKALSYAERFQIAKAAGFEGVEISTVTNDAEAQEIKQAATDTGLIIHSVMNDEHWRSPLSSDDPAVIAKGVAGIEQSLRNAKLWGCDSVLLVPGVVNPQTSYKDAWTRSQRVIKERVIPAATAAKVTIGIEEVWNKFLLSPLEMARYVDELNSPFIKVYLDVGNMLFYGYPQDWIRTLGPRISRVHIKDFKLDRGKGVFAWTNIGDGDVDWVAVRTALNEVGYTGWITTEIAGGDAAYLKDVVARFDRFLAGQKPVVA